MKWVSVDRHYIYTRDEGRCRHCGKSVRYGSMSLDHYLPHSVGGPDAVYNLVCACKACNRDKRAQVPEDWQVVWAEAFRQGVMDRKLALAPGITYRELMTCVAEIVAVRLMGNIAIFDTKYKRIHVKHNAICKITNINIFSDE